MLEREELLRRAIAIASAAHAAQVDKAGEPYIFHVLRVGIPLLPDVEAAAAGVLHDVIEDADPIYTTQLEEQMPPPTVAAVRALTKPEDEPWEMYIERVATDPIAVKVKLSDLKDNLDPDRREAALYNGADRDHIYRLASKYLWAQAYLRGKLNG